MWYAWQRGYPLWGEVTDQTGLDWIGCCVCYSPLLCLIPSFSLFFALFLPHMLLLHPTLCTFISLSSSHSLILICPPTLAHAHTHTHTHTHTYSLTQLIPSLFLPHMAATPYTTLGHIHNFTLLTLTHTLTHTHSCTHSRTLTHTSLFLPHMLHPTLRHIRRLWDRHL